MTFESGAGDLTETCRLAPGILFEWFDNEAVIYHQASGDTHCLQGPAAHLFKRLGNGPVSLPVLIDDPQLALDEDDLGNCLDELERLHLIKIDEPAPNAA